MTETYSLLLDILMTCLLLFPVWMLVQEFFVTKRQTLEESSSIVARYARLLEIRKKRSIR